MAPTGEELFDAIDDGDVERVRKLLRKDRGLLLERDEGGLPPLLRAAMSLGRDPELLTALIDGGADVRAATEEGETALHLSIDVEGDSGLGDEPLTLLRPLVEAGANLEAQQADGLTPLALAVVHGTPFEVAALAKLGASVEVDVPAGHEVERLAGRTLLGAALGSPDKVEALLRAGADRARVDASGRTPSELCATLLEQARGDGAEELCRALEACAAMLAGD